MRRTAATCLSRGRYLRYTKGLAASPYVNSSVVARMLCIWKGSPVEGGVKAGVALWGMVEA